MGKTWDEIHGVDKANAMRAHRKSIEYRTKLSVALQGRSYEEQSTPDQAEQRIAKMQASLTGHEVSEETRAKISSTKKGRVLSPETKAKMSEAAKNRKKKSPSEGDST